MERPDRSREHYQQPFTTKGVRRMTEKQAESIEKLSEVAEVVLENNYEKKDLKERRSQSKMTLYDGSKKLKHSIPKGKRI